MRLTYVPAGCAFGVNAGYWRDLSVWSNSTQPYLKNYGVLTFEGLSIGNKSAQGAFYTWVAVSADGNSESSSPAGGVFVAKNGTLTVNPDDLGLLSSITVTKVSGPATKIGLGNIAILTPPADVVLDFTVRLTDGDNDYADRMFSVSIDGNNDGLITDPISAASLPVGAPLMLASAEPDMMRSGLNDQLYQIDYML